MGVRFPQRVPKGLKLLILMPPFLIILLGVITMRIYNRTNIPERTAKDAVSIIINKQKDSDNQRFSVDKMSETLYYVKIFGYPTIKVEIEDDDATISLFEETD